MPVRFVIGRAGVGKTHHCLTALRERLATDPLAGPALVLLVPEQASLQTERALFEPPGLDAVHRATVLSFQRLALRIDEETGRDPRTVLSADARHMVLRRLLTQLGPELRYFKRPDRFPGLLDQLGRTIEEFIQESIAPTEIARLIEAGDSPIDVSATAPNPKSKIQNPKSEDPLRSPKLHDLQRIFSAYLDYLGAERLDPSQRLDAARARIGACAWLHGAEVWVDGFAGFTRQERNLLVALARVAGRMNVTLLMDPGDSISDFGFRISEGGSRALFAKTGRTFESLQRQLADHDVVVESPHVINPEIPPRFIAAPQLAAVEQSLFQAPPSHSEIRNPKSEIPSFQNLKSKIQNPQVQLIQAADRRVEVSYVVAAIAHLVQTSAEGLRYRDIGIAVRDLEPYHDLLSAALDARRIPYFMDRRRPTAHHPLVECVRALVQLAVEPLTPEPVRLLLKTGLLRLEPDEADAIENHLVAAEPSGIEAWSKPWHGSWGPRAARDKPEARSAADRHTVALNRARHALLTALEPWLQFAAGSPHLAEEWSAALWDCMDRIGAGARIEAWTHAAEDRGEMDRAAEHRQTAADLERLLDDMASALADEPMSPREAARVLEAALAQFSLGLTPPTLDQVLITAVERSRNPDLKALFVMGFNDGAFPRTHGEDALLNDDDRRWFAERGVEVRPPSDELLRDERMLAYIAFTRPSHRLFVSYAAADEGGADLRPSPWLEDLRAACPDAGFVSVDEPFRARSAWNVRDARDLAAHLAREYAGVRPPPREGRSPATSPDGSKPNAPAESARGLTPSAPDPRPLWNALYLRARNDAEAAPVLRRALAALDYHNRAVISVASASRLHPETLKTSVSQLETFAACAFQHFANYHLQLEPRRKAELRATDVGRLHHAVLEHFMGKLIADGKPFAKLDDAELVERLECSLAAVAANPPEIGPTERSRDAYVLASARRQVERALRAQRLAASLGDFQPAAAELPFGMNREGALPALEVSTPAGRRILLRGVIDRVDLAEGEGGRLGLVIDYKHTRDKRLSLANVYHGLSMQLLAYLLVLQQHGHLIGLEWTEGLRDRGTEGVAKGEESGSDGHDGHREGAIPKSEIRNPKSEIVFPAAALYVSLVDAYDRLDHPDAAAEDEESETRGTFPPRGLVDRSRMGALEREFAKAGGSQLYQVKLNKNGTISRLDASDAAEHEDFARILELTRRRIGELADGVLDGRVEVAPYRLATFSPCSWCDYRAVCRFEFPISPVRSLEPLKRSQVFERVRGDGRS